MAVSPILLAPSARATNPFNLLTTELNSLANNSGAISSAAAQNVTNLDLYADLELLCNFGTAPTAGTTIDCYFARSIDGTNYEDGSGSILPMNGFVGSFSVRAVTGNQRMVLPQVLLPPRDFYVILYNNGTGQAFAASGNTLRAYCYHLSVG